MSKKVSRGQALEVSGRIATQVKWDQIDGDELQARVISLSPEEFGRRFTAFLMAGARFIFGGGLKVSTVPFDPSKFIGPDWSFWKGPKDGNGLEGEEKRDETSLSLTEVDFDKADFLTCLEESESSINGEEKLVHIQKLGRTLYGASVGLGLWHDYQECQNKADSKLEKLYAEKGVAYIDFFGDILRAPGGSRSVLCLDRHGDGSWYWGSHCLDSDWDDCNLTAVSQQVSF